MALRRVASSWPSSGSEGRARPRLEAALAGADTPGLQYVVVGRGATRLELADGAADLAVDRAFQSSTTTMIYSMTKAITAVAVLQLVERGQLGLDDRVIERLPWIPYGDRVTIGHLLSQTSGIPDPIPLRWVHRPAEHATFDEEARLRGLVARHPRLRFPPGARSAYSNLSYWLLGRVVEQVTGGTYEAYVTREVFGRLGLSPGEIGFTIPEVDRHARGYLPRWSFLGLVAPLLVDRRFLGGHHGPWRQIEDNYLDGAAFGGVVASARAVGRFLQDQLEESPVLLDPETRRRCFTPWHDARGAPVPMTLGWHVARRRGGSPFFFKEGGGAGFHGEMRVYLDAGIASVAIGNSGAFHVKAFLDAADREFLPRAA